LVGVVGVLGEEEGEGGRGLRGPGMKRRRRPDGGGAGRVGVR